MPGFAQSIIRHSSSFAPIESLDLFEGASGSHGGALGSYHILPTTTWMDPPSTGDLRRWGALLTTGWGLSFGSPRSEATSHIGATASKTDGDSSVEPAARAMEKFAPIRADWVGLMQDGPCW